MYTIHESQFGGQVGENTLVVGGFTEPIKLIVKGFGSAIIVAEGTQISDDGLSWKGRITTDFDDMFQIVYIKPMPDVNDKATIKVEQA